MMSTIEKRTNAPFVAGVVVLLCVSMARGATIRRVDVDSTCSSGCDGSTWALAYKALTTALSDANSGDEIWVAAIGSEGSWGSYKPTTGADRGASFEIADGVQLYGGFDGTETLRSARDIEANETILSGAIPSGNPPVFPSNSYHVVKFDTDVGRETVLDGFTIERGFWGVADSDSRKGAGIYNPDGSPYIRNCRIQDCDGLFGGGMYSGQGEPFIENCIFAENSAGQGGGLHLKSAGATAKVVNCTFTENDAFDISEESINGHGGGMYLSLSSPEIRNSIFWNNAADQETDETAQVYYASGTVNIEYCCIENCASASAGDYCFVSSDKNIDDDPVFTSPPTDLTLGATTPCDDVGNNHSVNLRLDRGGDARVQNCDVDMGAYERTSTTACTFYVDTTKSATDNEGTSWTEAFKSLQDALDVGKSGDLIWVADGTYYPDEGSHEANNDRFATFQLPDGIVVIGGFAGVETEGVECTGNGNYCDRFTLCFLGQTCVRNECVGNGEFCESAGDCPFGQTCEDNRGGNASMLSGDVDNDDSTPVIGRTECEDDFTAACSGGPAPAACGTCKHASVLPHSEAICDTVEGAQYINDECRILTPIDQTRNAGNSYHVVSVDETANLVVIDGFTISAGNANASGPPDHQGPGLTNRDRADATVIDNDLTVRNCVFDGNFSNNHGALNDHGLDTTVDGCTFSGNYTDVRGGGMYVHQGSNAFITNCTFSGNYSGSKGGGLYVNSASGTVSSPTVEGSTFSDNIASAAGGAIYLAQGSTAKIKALAGEPEDRSLFLNNAASAGGGIYSDESSPTIQDSDFFANDATSISGGYGGAIYGNTGGSLAISGCDFVENHSGTYGTIFFVDADGSVSDCRFVRNTGDSFGGGVAYGGIGGPVSVDIANSTFVGNDGENGGGVIAIRSSGSVQNCLFVGNRAGSNGGGILLAESNVAITNCTIALNHSAGKGGGMTLSDTMAGGADDIIVVNTIVWNNTAVSSGDQIEHTATGSGTAAEISYCDIEGSGGSSSWDTGLGNDGGGNIDADPDFVSSTTGTWDTASDSVNFDSDTYQTTFTDANASFGATDALKDLVFRGNTDNDNYTYIAGSTGTTIIVWGDVSSDYVNLKTYEILDFHVQDCSPVVDAGDDTALPEDVTDIDGDDDFDETLPLDLDLVTREVNDTGVTDTGNGTAPIVDMGAYEKQDNSSGCN